MTLDLLLTVAFTELGYNCAAINNNSWVNALGEKKKRKKKYLAINGAPNQTGTILSVRVVLKYAKGYRFHKSTDVGSLSCTWRLLQAIISLSILYHSVVAIETCALYHIVQHKKWLHERQKKKKKKEHSVSGHSSFGLLWLISCASIELKANEQSNSPA